MDGAGTLYLAGAKSFKGGALITSGVLQIDDATAINAGPFAIGNGGRLQLMADNLSLSPASFSLNGAGVIDTNGHNASIGSVMTDGASAGEFIKDGAGVLALTAASTFTGGAEVRAGTLALALDNALSSRISVQVDRGAFLDLQGHLLDVGGISGAGTISGGASGSGRLEVGANGTSSTFDGLLKDGGAVLTLTKLGAGTLTLTGANAFSGGTFLDAGRLVIANSQALGSGALSMADNTTLGFSGVANLSNRIIFAGAADPTIDTGTARVTLSGVISGPGALTKIGSGTLVLAGADTYAGATLVSQGTLQVDGSITSATTVGQGAALSGTGVVGAIDVLPGGALAPGNANNPFGALHATGNVSFAPGSTYLVTLNPTAASLLSSSGSASLAGAVAATWTGGTPGLGARYTILTASEGVKGTFGSLTFQGLATNLPVLAYDANDVYLVFSGLSGAAVQASMQQLAGARQGAMVTNQVLSSVLGGINEQINCTNCVSGFGSVGSLSGGVHGRLTLNSNLALLGGAAYAQYKSGGVFVTSAPLFLTALRYDKTEWGSSRPFAEIGVSASPWQQVTYTRFYDDAGTARIGRGASIADDFSTFGKLGWIARFSPIDEAAVHLTVSRTWQIVGGYTEGGVNNPSPATFAGGTDVMNIAGVGGQWTHLFGQNLEAQIGLALEQSFGSRSGVSGTVAGLSSGAIVAGEYHWLEFGGRIGYRIGNGFVADIFADGTLGAQPVGNTIHGGIGLRYAL
jgi:autotransporter-associated beta strand protein